MFPKTIFTIAPFVLLSLGTVTIYFNTFLSDVTNVSSRSNRLLQEATERIPINLESSLGPHILSFVHFPERRRIEMRTKPSTRCPDPSVIGRLSGKTIGFVEWDRTTTGPSRGGKEPLTLAGTYALPDGGTYFVEIIVIYCKKISDQNFDDNIRKKCVEAPIVHRLTAPSASITVTHEHMTNTLPGYWESPFAIPMYTRWQPDRCRPPHSLEERCISKTTLLPFEKYQFRWRISVPELKDVIRGDVDDYSRNCVDDFLGAESSCRVCTVGASHGRRLFRYLEAIHVTGGGYYNFKFPSQVTQSDASEIKKMCPVIILSFGQWSLSSSKLTPPNQFSDDMRNLLRKFKDHKSVHVNNVHHSPLGDVQTHCPVWDMRTPPVVERYNTLVRGVCKEMGFDFIDSEFITRPLWDSALDWNHLNEKVQIVEAHYVAYKLKLM